MLVDAIRAGDLPSEIDAATRALLDACVKLTLTPSEMTAADVDQLRSRGFNDRAIHDAFQIAGYFNYINRVCDGLGVDLEDFMPAAE